MTRGLAGGLVTPQITGNFSDSLKRPGSTHATW